MHFDQLEKLYPFLGCGHFAIFLPPPRITAQIARNTSTQATNGTTLAYMPGIIFQVLYAYPIPRSALSVSHDVSDEAGLSLLLTARIHGYRSLQCGG